MNKTFYIAAAFIIAFSAAAFAQSNVNVSILYGWNGTHAVPLLTTAEGRLQVDLNTTRSVGLNPRLNDSYDLGTALLRWQDIYLQRADALEYMNTTVLQVRSNIILPDNAILSAEIDTLAATEVTAGTFAAGNFTFQNNLTALGILNSSGTSFNNTFYGDIRINGTLYGFAPLRIGTGLNITGDLNVTGGTVNFPSGYLTTFNGGINGINMNFTGSANFATSGGRVGILNNIPNATLHVTGAANVLALNVNNSLYVNTTTSNVGIRTTAPNFRLSLGSSVNDYLLGIYDAGSAPYGFGIRSSQLMMYADDAAVITFGHMTEVPSGTFTERMRIDTAGNVGIGTTSPNATLQVNGSFGIINATTGAFLMYVNSTTGRVGIGTTAPSGRLHIGGTDQRMYLGTGGYFVINRGAGASQDIYFGETADTGNYVFRSSGNLTIEGNVGIGTTTPGRIGTSQFGTTHTFVNIAGSSTSNQGILNLQNTATTDGSLVGSLNFGSTGLTAAYGDIARIYGEIDGSTANQMGGALVFDTRANAATTYSERMRIDQSGNVGISASARRRRGESYMSKVQVAIKGFNF
ncbi:MAG: hypothetical protein HYT73_02075 [Candidatus Aenigmarchaeota archaeon]|nr:hypothetical protein [Candidatus Aenigmarchaeota archaeon]